MIFNLLIVDDEAPIRKGISQFVNWESLDCVISGTASDGREAIKLLQECPIDIVITDVRMPEVDGLQLAEYICANYPEIKIIILTGFADFQYAQAAIKYGVSDFLVKPIAKDKIIASVQKAQERIITSKQKERVKKSEIAFLKEQLLQELTLASHNTDLLSKLNQYDLILNSYYLVAFQLFPHADYINSVKEIIINQNLAGYCYRYNHLIILVCFVPPAQQDVPGWLIPSCEELSDMIVSLYECELSIGISNYHCLEADFSLAAREAISAMTLNFYSNSNIAFFADKGEACEYAISTDETLQLYELETEILQCRFDNVTIILNSIFSKLKTNFAKSVDVKNICTQIYYIGLRVLLQKGLKAPDDELFHQIKHATRIFELEQIIKTFMIYLEESMHSSQNVYSKIVHNTIDYINANIAVPLHLKSIADAIHMNASYLSRTFKKETGQSVTEYINICRIEKAKELLSNRENLTYEVATQVGFNDPAYFSSTFKKYTGISPKQYKSECYSKRTTLHE